MFLNESYQFLYTLNSLNIKNLKLNNYQLWEFIFDKSNFRVKQQYFIFLFIIKILTFCVYFY